MFDDYRICPYPGLRSFNEDESIYFKGREENIEEVISLVQKNKFLMVTGASGDGKSSLIFAGLVPNARAGFFKATYNNWSVSHFRPERDPVKNFSHSLIQLFTELNEQTIETELNRGFSSLVDLYKNSPLFFDESTNQYQDATDEEKRSIKRQSSNLLIVVDQFEEFFTNSENFVDGVPSLESQTLINLLLETAQIALRDNLPIYVVFTMRSDYIGQCASFRGLPEYIGFSQFFVPRLKRKDLQQVIEQPAELNGDTISRRLVERLLFDLSDGEDQLPILQHTLSRIWHRAEEQKVPMDLVHYAEVGGMSALELPEKEKEQFEIWYSNLPDWKKSEYNKPGLRRVLHIHANELYQQAWEKYHEMYPEKPISIADSKRIIAIAFACLTKIDDSRAVRNLMTLGEITRIINKPHLNVDVVEAVLRIFRKEGNTFIRPFVSDDDPETLQLASNTVLDITHESLIRNWDKLSQWAEKEYSYYETFLDFEKQLNKWTNSSRSRDFLLPIGSLSYFENWYIECQPNISWINRYIATERAEKDEAGSILENSRDFIRKSARKVAITRAFMRYGTARIASLIAIIFVMGLSGFYYMDANKKQNGSVLVKIQEKGLELMNDPLINSIPKSIYLLANERLNAGSSLDYLSMIDSSSIQADIANTAIMIAFSLDNKFNPPGKDTYYEKISELLHSSDMKTETRLLQLNFYLFNRVNEIYNLPSSHEIRSDKIELILELIEELKEGKVENMLEFNHGINHVLNLGTTDDTRKLLDLLSPFEESSRATFKQLYPVNASVINGRAGGLTHNGGYQVMGSIYAALGDLDRSKQCLDSLLKYNSRYMEIESFNNGFNLLGYLVKNDHHESATNFLSYFSQVTGIDKSVILRRIMDRTGFMKYIYSYYWFEIPALNYGLSLMEPDKIAFLFDLYENMLNEETRGNELNYKLAMMYKQRGIYIHRNATDREFEADIDEINTWFDKAIEHYNKVSPDYLDGQKTTRYRYYLDGFRSMDRPRWYFFLYPDHFETGWYNDKFTSTAFAEYLFESGQFHTLLTTGEELEVFNDWIANYNERYNNVLNARRNLPEFTLELQNQIYESALNEKYSQFDKTYLHLLLANRYFENGNDDKGYFHFNEISVDQLQPLVARWEYLNYTFIQNQILELSKNLARRSEFDLSKTLLETMSNNNDRSITYTEVAKDLFKSGNATVSFQFLDSAISKGTKVDESIMPNQFSYRYYLINALSGIGGKKMNDMAYNFSNQVPVTNRDFAINYYIQGIAFEGNYFRAYQAIPQVGPKNQRFIMYASILGEASERSGPREGWETFDKEWKHVFKDYVVFDNNY